MLWRASWALALQAMVFLRGVLVVVLAAPCGAIAPPIGMRRHSDRADRVEVSLHPDASMSSLAMGPPGPSAAEAHEAKESAAREASEDHTAVLLDQGSQIPYELEPLSASEQMNSTTIVAVGSGPSTTVILHESVVRSTTTEAVVTPAPEEGPPPQIMYDYGRLMQPQTLHPA